MAIETGFPTFLAVLIGIPFVGFLIILLTPKKQEEFIKWIALMV